MITTRTGRVLHGAGNAAVMALATTISLVLIAGTALAYWKATGSANGNSSSPAARAGTSALTTTSTIGTLHPNSSGDVSITFANPNTFAVKVTALSFGTVAAAGCTTPDVTISSSLTAAALGTGLPVAAHTTADGTATLTIANGATMGQLASSDCQTKSLSVALTITWTA
jgi:hypothetical protein